MKADLRRCQSVVPGLWESSEISDSHVFNLKSALCAYPGTDVGNSTGGRNVLGVRQSWGLCLHFERLPVVVYVFASFPWHFLWYVGTVGVMTMKLQDVPVSEPAVLVCVPSEWSTAPSDASLSQGGTGHLPVLQSTPWRISVIFENNSTSLSPVSTPGPV